MGINTIQYYSCTASCGATSVHLISADISAHIRKLSVHTFIPHLSKYETLLKQEHFCIQGNVVASFL